MPTPSGLDPRPDFRRHGIVVALYPSDSRFEVEIDIAPDSVGNPDLGNITVAARVPPMRRRVILDLPAEDTIYHVRARHVRKNYTNGTETSWFAARAQAIPSILPLVPPVPIMALDLRVDPLTGLVSFFFDGEPQVKSILWESVTGSWPSVPLSSPTTDNTDPAGDHNELDYKTINENETEFLVVVAYAGVNGAGRKIGTLRKSVTRGGIPVDCFPTLDEDDGSLDLFPNRTSSAEGVYYIVHTSAQGPPNQAETEAGTFSTLDELLGIHTFTTDGELVHVGVVAVKDQGLGSEVTGPLKLLRHTFNTADSGPRITWRKAVPAGPDTSDKEAIEFTVTDDGNDVAFWIRDFDKGAAPPAWAAASHRHTDSDGTPDATGYGADPLVIAFTYNRPVEGGTPRQIDFKAEDNAGQETPIFSLFVDGDGYPEGDFAYGVNATGDPYIIARPSDPDAGSWRLHAEKLNATDATFTDPNWSDVDTDEYKGNTFGAEVTLTNHNFNVSQRINCSAFFLRTTSTTGTVQQNSLRSRNIRFSITRNFVSIPPKVEFVPDQTGTTATVTLTITDIFGSFLNEVRWKVHQGPGDFNFGNPGAWADFDTAAPWEHSATIASEKYSTIIAWAVKYTDADGTVSWEKGFHPFDLNTIPNILWADVGHNDAREFFLSAGGDEDVGSFRYKTSTVSMPTDTVGGTVVNGRTMSQVSLGTEGFQVTKYVRVSAFAGAGATGTQSPTDAQVLDSTGTDEGQGTLPFSVREEIVQPNGLAIRVDDPDGLVEAILFGKASGRVGSFPDPPAISTGDWNSGFGAFATTETVTLTEKHDSYIAYAIRWDDGTGDKWHVRVVSFDKDTTPSLEMLSLSVLDDGTVELSWAGDSDLNQIKHIGSATAFDTYANTIAGNASSGRTGTTVVKDSGGTTLTLAEGQRAFVTVVGHNTADNIYTPAPVIELKSAVYKDIEGGGNSVQVNGVTTEITGGTPLDVEKGARISITVGSAVKSVSVRARIDGTPAAGHPYNYDIDGATAPDENIKVQVNRTNTALLSMDATKPWDFRLIPYTGVNGTGTPGSAKIVTIADPLTAGGGGITVEDAVGVQVYSRIELPKTHKWEEGVANTTGVAVPRFGVSAAGSQSGGWTPNAATANYFTVTFNTGAVLNKPTNMKDGQEIYVELTIGTITPTVGMFQAGINLPRGFADSLAGTNLLVLKQLATGKFACGGIQDWEAGTG